MRDEVRMSKADGAMPRQPATSAFCGDGGNVHRPHMSGMGRKRTLATRRHVHFKFPFHNRISSAWLTDCDSLARLFDIVDRQFPPRGPNWTLPAAPCRFHSGILKFTNPPEKADELGKLSNFKRLSFAQPKGLS